MRKAPPPPPNSLPGVAPPPPVGLPGAPGATNAISEKGNGGYTPTSSSSVGRGRSSFGAPPPPVGLPLAPSDNLSTPPPPSSLPGATSPSSSSTRRSSSFSGVPPPPGGLPEVRTGPSESGFAAPPPPSGLPGALPTGKNQRRTSSKGVRRTPLAPPPPPAPGTLPGASPISAPVQTTFPPAPLDEDEEEEFDDSWRQQLQNDSGDGNASSSGEDSDEESSAQVNDNRHRNDMDLLLRQSRNSLYGSATPSASSRSGGRESQPKLISDECVKQNGEAEETSPVAMDKEESDSTPSKSGKKRGSLLSRLSTGIFGKSGSEEGSLTAGEGLSQLLKEESTAKHDDAWYQKWSFQLSKDGFACTKVATNGKPYERFLHIDSRNLLIEIRGGRGGATGVLLDDLVDIRQGLHSPEFSKFSARFKNEPPPELSKKSAVLQTPSRTFSFIFRTEAQRYTICHFIVYLLKSRKRGIMADGPIDRSPNGGERDIPMEGRGNVSYSNRSTYEGEFQNRMRHGRGTLTLSDGTKYEAMWRNDERHGEGKEYWSDGTIFTGLYVRGMRNGFGLMTWPEGSKYAGQFERGRANGAGELVRTDGSVYTGTFSEDCMHGDGSMRWRDGVSYVGQFLTNRREGFGKMVWTSGRWKSYEGYWKEGMQHGHGTLVDQEDSEFSGTFICGKLDKWDDDV